MDRGAWWATVHGVARVGHDLATKPPPKQWESGWIQQHPSSSYFWQTNAKSRSWPPGRMNHSLSGDLSIFCSICCRKCFLPRGLIVVIPLCLSGQAWHHRRRRRCVAVKLTAGLCVWVASGGAGEGARSSTCRSSLPGLLLIATPWLTKSRDARCLTWGVPRAL